MASKNQLIPLLLLPQKTVAILKVDWQNVKVTDQFRTFQAILGIKQLDLNWIYVTEAALYGPVNERVKFENFGQEVSLLFWEVALVKSQMLR